MADHPDAHSAGSVSGRGSVNGPSDEVIEAAAVSYMGSPAGFPGPSKPFENDYQRRKVTGVLAAVYPIIRADVLAGHRVEVERLRESRAKALAILSDPVQRPELKIVYATRALNA